MHLAKLVLASKNIICLPFRMKKLGYLLCYSAAAVILLGISPRTESHLITDLKQN